MAQTNFQLYSDRFALGQIADNSLNQIDSFIASTVIPFGAPVMRVAGSETKVAYPLTAVTQGICVGFAIRREMEVTGQYEIGHQIDVLRLGRIVVQITTGQVATVDQKAYAYTIVSTIGSDPTNGLLVGRFTSNSIVQNISLNGVMTDVTLAELQITMLTNA